MQIKTFRAANLQAALEEIREQLGPNASVLRTRQCREGFMGWLGRSYVEVTASPGNSPDPSHTIAFRPPNPWSSRSNALSSDPGSHHRLDLIALGVEPVVADRWIRATEGFVAHLSDRVEPAWTEHLQRSVSREINLSGPIRLSPGERRIVALIGPTGVGKTTTVAKLAAGFRIGQKRRVGLLTIDTFRIAAVQQLQAYAQIMDLPMSVVESRDQMDDAIDRLGDVDLILIDTAGRSPKGDINVEGLAELLSTAQPDETHLVMSATSTAAVVRSAIRGFAAARPNAAILTKLDEAPYTAGVLSAITPNQHFSGIPISYVTNGQHVPEDIAIATAECLIERLVPAPIQLPQIEAA